MPKRPPGRHVHKVERRLEPDIILQLVHDYEAGVPSTELTGRYGLSKATVLRLLRDHGATIRRQGLSPAQVDEATRLYESGLSLAKIGDQLGFHLSSVHHALLRAGVPMRPRKGGRTKQPRRPVDSPPA